MITVVTRDPDYSVRSGTRQPNILDQTDQNFRGTRKAQTGMPADLRAARDTVSLNQNP